MFRRASQRRPAGLPPSVAGIAIVLAGSFSAAPLGGEDTATRWHRTLVENQERVAAGDWEAAYPVARDLVHELVSDLKGGGEAPRLLATAYAQRAFSEAGLGRPEDAAWSFAVAQNLEPAFRRAPLEPFGPAVAALEAHRLPDSHPGDLGLDREGLLPPRIVDATTIVFRAAPEILASFDRTLVVEVLIDREGNPRVPIVRGRVDNPSPVALSLEVLRRWRFEPARIGSHPVPVRLELDLPLTRGAAGRIRARLEALQAPRPD